ncbi:MAG: transglutaminase domain-containing protein [Geodermatophilaceae bacterium]|nr:transglutaminase domain-containing protein [Geodermatophilaceae bacterium]
MTSSTRLALASGAATLLACLAFSPVFLTLSWVFPVVVVVGAVVAVSIGARRVPALAPWAPLLELVGGTIALTALYANDTALFGVLPTPSAFGAMRDLLNAAGYAVRTQISPAQSLPELLFLASVGAGLVAVAVDILTVSMRRAALAGLALIALFIVPASAVTDGIGVLPFLGGAGGYLLLLFVSGRESMLRWGRRTGEQTPGFGVRAAQRIALLSLVAGLMLPVFIPQLPQGILRPSGSGSGTGVGTSLNPLVTLAGELTLPEPLDLLRVTANVEDPYYLRVTTLEDYTDTGWTPGSLDDTFDANEAALPGTPSGPTRQVDAEIQVLDQNDRFLATYNSPTDVDADGDWRYDPISGTVWSRDDRTAGLTYRVSAQEPNPTIEDLLDANQLDADDQVQRRFTSLPPIVRPEVARLVNDLTESVQGPYERTRAIMAFFTDRSSGFVYDLATEGGTSGDDLVDFLTNRQGYCQQYAGAMAVLLRFADVPARVAIGYTRGARNAGLWTVSTDDAHAWVEVYFDGIGWVPFDPTPLTAGRGVNSAWEPAVGAAAPTTTAPRTTVAGVDPGAVPRQREEELPISAGAAGNGSSGLLNPRVLLTVVAILLGVGLVVTPAVLRVVVRRRRRERAATGDAHAAWDELLATMSDLRLTWGGAETPRSTARRLAREHDFDAVTAEAMRMLAVAEERARYAPPATRTSDGLDDAVVAVTAGLRADAPSRDRARAVLVPPSILRAGSVSVRTAQASAWGRLRAVVGSRPAGVPR